MLKHKNICTIIKNIKVFCTKLFCDMALFFASNELSSGKINFGDCYEGQILHRFVA